MFKAFVGGSLMYIPLYQLLLLSGFSAEGPGPHSGGCGDLWRRTALGPTAATVAHCDSGGSPSQAPWTAPGLTGGGGGLTAVRTAPPRSPERPQAPRQPRWPIAVRTAPPPGPNDGHRPHGAGAGPLRLARPPQGLRAALHTIVQIVCHCPHGLFRS